MIVPIMRCVALGMAVCGLAACATSMTPRQFNEELPSLTKSKYFDPAQAKDALKHSRCELLVGGRSYVAPMGLTVNGDLRNGSKGIDEWVSIDGGNSYVLNNFKWITIDSGGSTQLSIYFDTMQCE